MPAEASTTAALVKSPVTFPPFARCNWRTEPALPTLLFQPADMGRLRELPDRSLKINSKKTTEESQQS